MEPSAVDTFLTRPFAVRALLALLDKGPLAQGEFVQASGYKDDEGAKALREDLERWGLVHVEPTGTGGKGWRISLSTAGRRAAELARAIGEPALRLRAIKALVALLERGPLTTRELAETTRYTSANTKLLREDLEEWGLVVKDEVPQGASHQIELTPRGRRVAELCAELVRVVERGAKAP